MKYLDKIVDSARQRMILTGIPGRRITLELRFIPTQQRWMMDIESNDFIARGIMVTASANMLRNFKNIIPFGLGCSSKDGFDPYFIEDFMNGRCALYLLDAADVAAIEERVFSE